MIPAEVEQAAMISDSNGNALIRPSDFVLAISQSGETAVIWQRCVLSMNKGAMVAGIFICCGIYNRS